MKSSNSGSVWLYTASYTKDLIFKTYVTILFYKKGKMQITESDKITVYMCAHVAHLNA